MTDPDIVTRLRRCGCCDSYEAADEIERLRHELDGARLAYRGAGYDRDRMRAERDEARRMYCVMRDGDNGLTCVGWAMCKGWDCFKEEP